MTERLALDLQNIYSGPAWHGSPLREIVSGVDEASAQARPIANARTIAELTAHVSAWLEIVERRLRGEVFDIPHEMDFPPGDAMPFADALVQMDQRFERLLSTLRAFSEELLDTAVPSKKYTHATMLTGLAHHCTYHAAQIAMLKKFTTPSGSRHVSGRTPLS